MNQSSANLLLAGKAEIRSIGEPCDPSCAMWFACANSTPNGTCKGFVLLDGKSKEILRKNMQEDDLIYLGNCARTIQNGCTPETKESLTKEVYRYLKPINDILKEQQKRLPQGFKGMLEAVSRSADREEEASSAGNRRRIAGVMPEAGVDECNLDCSFHQWCAHFENQALCKGFSLIETKKRILRNLGFGGMLDESLSRSLDREEKPITRFIDGFLGMLQEASRGTDSESSSAVITRGFRIPPTNIKKSIRRIPQGFREMIDEVSGTTDEKEEVQTVVRSINYGFAGMLEDAFGRENPTTTPKPVVRNFGFRGMLDAISRTNEEEETFQPIVRSVECGFKAMAEDAFESKPICRGFERELRSLLDEIHSAR
jgi:hypothetical protein